MGRYCIRNSRFFEAWTYWFTLTSGDAVWINKTTGVVQVEYRNSELFDPTGEDQKKEIALQPFIDKGFVYQCTLSSGRRIFYNPITNEWGKEQVYTKPIEECNLPAMDTIARKEKQEAQTLLLEKAKKEWEQLSKDRQVILTKLEKRKTEIEKMLVGNAKKNWRQFTKVKKKRRP